MNNFVIYTPERLRRGRWTFSHDLAPEVWSTQDELNMFAWSYFHDGGLEVAFTQTVSASTAPLEVWVRNSGRDHAGCPIEPGNEGGWHYGMLSPRQPQS